MEFILTKAIAGVPRPGTYFMYNYFSNAHQLCQVIIAIKIYKIYFSMFLFKSQRDNVNTTLRLHYYDNRHKYERLHDWSMNRAYNEQLTMHNRH